MAKKTKSGLSLAVKKVRRYSKHWFVPHKGNNYHPHIIRWHGLVLTAAVSLMTHVVYGYATTGQFAVLGRSVTISTTELINQTNQIRLKNHMGELTVDSRLITAAQNKAEDMIKNNYWAHNSPSGLTPWHFIQQAGFNYDIAGENLAKNYPDATDVMNAWMASETHRENILNPKFTSVGFAEAEGVIGAKITTIVVAYYATPVTAMTTTDDRSAVLGAESFTSYSNPLMYIGGIVKNLSPANIGLLFIVMGLMIVASSSFLARHYLPKNARKFWQQHHGLIKAMAMSVLAAMLLITSSGSAL